MTVKTRPEETLKICSEMTELGASQSAEKMPPSATDSVQKAMNDVRLKMKKLF